ncbi:hypothetical protein ASPNIDRAFT_210350 [Aspergillus niger ATCC 1015]|uniref:Major facilitator superfamily (MFS) profile domain-containing protein n=1 Tax=Aspergillus niger (strain ATCC 1015 / CBS 113.46 / FGSC A1144 / LSHB Ac4 / NCTC 3858a / NRRL 328 / USDA 3528.7) TaxID=380704 RepID=G3XX13_ASPNA|nr:hypothetical protein ASPNIDRAFT_210350 [Aspergillus niger ATCC 1015]
MHRDEPLPDPPSTSSPPWKLAFRSSRAFVISVVAIAVFTDVFIYGMIVPILPIVLKTRVIVPEDELQKWMSIMLAAFGGGIFFGSPIFGYFADRSSSRQLPFLIGLLALAGTTIVFWFAETVSFLVIARSLQGLSAAVVWTVGLALVVDTVGKDQVGAAMGYVSMALTVGTVFDICLRLVMVEPKNAAQWIQSGSGGETQALLNEAETHGAGYDAITANARAGQTSGLGNEYPTEGSGEPLTSGRSTSVPGIIRLIFSGKLLVVLLATVVDAIIWSAFDTVLPLYVMKTFGWGSFEIGLCFLPLFAPSFLSPWIGDAVDRWGALRVAFVGFLLDFPTLLLFQLVARNTTQDQVLLYVFLFLAGVASTLQMVSLMTEVNNVTERYEREFPGIFGHQGGTAQAYGLFNVAWSGGQVLGPLVAGLLVERAGWTTMVTVLGAVSGGISVVIALSDRRVLPVREKK